MKQYPSIRSKYQEEADRHKYQNQITRRSSIQVSNNKKKQTDASIRIKYLEEAVPKYQNQISRRSRQYPSIRIKQLEEAVSKYQITRRSRQTQVSESNT